MKKTVLATAILIASSSVSAVEIYKTEDGNIDFYGQLRTELHFNDGEDATLKQGSSRTGVKAAYSLTDSTDVFGHIEIDLRGGDRTNRVHLAGFKGDFGQLYFGKDWTISDHVYGADYSYFYGGSALRYSTLSGASHAAQVVYKYISDSFWVNTAYGVPGDKDENQELFELYAGTSFGNLDLHAGVGTNTDKAVESILGTLDLTNTYYELTAEYNFNKALVGATVYGATLEDNNSTAKIDEIGLSLAGTYQVAQMTKLYAGYEFTTQEANSGHEEDGTVAYVGVEQKFNSWSRVYAEYGYGDGTTLGYVNSDSDNVIGVTSTDSASSNFAIGFRVYW